MLVPWGALAYATEGDGTGDVPGSESSAQDTANGDSSDTSGQSSASGDGGQSSASGDGGQSSASGDGGQSGASGDGGQSGASGDGGQSSASGDGGQSSASGDGGQSGASGDGGQSSASGDGGQSSDSGDGQSDSTEVSTAVHENSNEPPSEDNNSNTADSNELTQDGQGDGTGTTTQDGEGDSGGDPQATDTSGEPASDGAASESADANESTASTAPTEQQADGASSDEGVSTTGDGVDTNSSSPNDSNVTTSAPPSEPDATTADVTETDAQGDAESSDPAPVTIAGQELSPTQSIEGLATEASYSQFEEAIADAITSEGDQGGPSASPEAVNDEVADLAATITDAVIETLPIDDTAGAVGPATSSLDSLVVESVDSGPTDDTAIQQFLITDTSQSSSFGTAEVTVASTEQGTLVQVIHTSQFDAPSPDPSGIAYIPQTDRLVITDSEVDEMTLFEGINLWQLTRTGTVTDTGVTTGSAFSTSKEPTGVGFNPTDGTLLVSDDQRRRISLVQPGADGRYGTADDQSVGSIDVTTFELPVDAEGVEYDANSGHVFIADGIGREIWRVDPGVNGTFGDADDVVTHFDVEQFGILDPEGIGTVPERDNLLIADRATKAIYEISKSGQLVRTIDLSSITELRRPAGVTLAPASYDSSIMNLWVVDRAVDNNADPNENDGKIFEISWPSAPGTPTSSTVTLEIAVARGSDDAEEKPNGSVATGESALELVEKNGLRQTVGLRFTGVSVPAGSTVTTAYIQFQAKKGTTKTTNLTLVGEASDNALTFTTTAFNISSRPRTTASAQWSPASWTTAGEAGVNQRTSDLSAVLQEIFNRPGWTSGNSLAIIITGTGKRIAKSFEGRGAPLLHIEFLEFMTASVSGMSSAAFEPVGSTSTSSGTVDQNEVKQALDENAVAGTESSTKRQTTYDRRFTPKSQQAALKAAGKGLSLARVARKAGISRRALKSWLKHGFDDPGSRYYNFANDFLRAQREARED